MSYTKGRHVGVGRRKRPPRFPGAKSTWPHSDPEEAVNESGGRWLKHRLSPMNGKSKKSDREVVCQSRRKTLRLTEDCMHSLIKKTQRMDEKLEHASVVVAKYFEYIYVVLSHFERFSS